jgi:hypothetical protein
MAPLVNEGGRVDSGDISVLLLGVLDLHSCADDGLP